MKHSSLKSNRTNLNKIMWKGNAGFMWTSRSLSQDYKLQIPCKLKSLSHPAVIPYRDNLLWDVQIEVISLHVPRNKALIIIAFHAHLWAWTSIMFMSRCWVVKSCSIIGWSLIRMCITQQNINFPTSIRLQKCMCLQIPPYKSLWEYTSHWVMSSWCNKYSYCFVHTSTCMYTYPQMLNIHIHMHNYAVLSR